MKLLFVSLIVVALCSHAWVKAQDNGDIEPSANPEPESDPIDAKPKPKPKPAEDDRIDEEAMAEHKKFVDKIVSCMKEFGVELDEDLQVVIGNKKGKDNEYAQSAFNKCLAKVEKEFASSLSTPKPEGTYFEDAGAQLPLTEN